MHRSFIRHTSLILAFSASFILSQAHAQSFGDLATELQARQVAPPVQETPSNTNWQQGTYGPVMNGKPMLSAEQIKPFGAELFTGGFRGVRADGLNPQYKILPGDQVTLRVWGAVDIDRILPVDAQGNIFIPTIGPVQVMGSSHSQLDGIVRAAVRKVYPDNVSVYTNLQGVQPVAVFVTGFVNKPGRYAGVPSDSILYFIDQASGVDDQLGSYRRIRLQRQGETIAELDLYQFILQGQLGHSQLQNGDTIIVESRGPVVTVQGDVGRPYHYELHPKQQQNQLVGQAITELTQLNAGVSHALIRGSRVDGPVASYLPLAEFANAKLNNGDEVLFIADQHEQQIVVQLEGEFMGQSHFVLPRNVTLQQLLNIIPIEPMLTDFENISLRRKSVAERQKQSLEDSLRRLETTYLGAPSSTAEESAIRIREAELISQFVAKARQVEPNGRLVVAHEGEIVDLRLQDGDIITIPPRTDAVLISGEVYIPQSVVFVPGKTAMDYIRGAGGFSQHADKKRILVVRQNGEVRSADEVGLRPGDEILVLPAVSTKNLQLASTMTQILYQIAVATKVALDL
ncbi:polysaccharide export protein [Rheinheimera sp. UJ51]|uniref:polysaccharide biosynthesis/export family protein n=1 Tax=Rheinheimera sp. UJ51 TaxID=2892446 RepID=UPI001E38B36F|nr:polysaccharide biosynthesis/export family protein [Rheinheimera sp. UJ51]MCC5450302.1 polysaccharide export protein [Rheinheimera sp. UJ51]